MTRLNPDKLFVEYRPGVTKTGPVEGRRYTLTHSDISADLFLTIGLQFAYDKVSAMRDEVLAEWKTNNGSIYLWVYVYVNGQFDPAVSSKRNEIFRRELPLALEAIRYGDSSLFDTHPYLDKAPIWVQFDSMNPKYRRLEYWGTPSDYKQETALSRGTGMPSIQRDYLILSYRSEFNLENHVKGIEI